MNHLSMDDYSGSAKRVVGIFVDPLEGTIYLVYKRYILSIGWLYATYHPLQEPK